jgi:hypothetical protein
MRLMRAPVKWRHIIGWIFGWGTGAVIAGVIAVAFGSASGGGNTSVVGSLILFGVVCGLIGGAMTSAITKRMEPSLRSISTRALTIGWSAAWAIGWAVGGGLLLGVTWVSSRETLMFIIALVGTLIGGIGGGVTFWQIARAQGAPASGIVAFATWIRSTSLAPEDTARWKPIAIIIGGWSIGWIIGLALAITAADGTSSTLALVLGWGAMGFATGLVWRQATRTRRWWQVVLLTIGWPTMLYVGLSQTFSAGPQGVALALSVGITWAINAVIALPPVQLRLRWWPALIVGAGSCVAWIVGNTYSWNFAAYTMFGRGLSMRSAHQDTLLLVNILLSAVIGGSLLLALQYYARRSTDTVLKS